MEETTKENRVMTNAKGTIQTRIIQIIPLLIMLSSTRITNGTNVNLADTYEASGRVWTLHLTPFIGIAIVAPCRLLKILGIKC